MENTEIENTKKAGEIHKKVVAYAKEIIKPGMKLLEIAEKIDAKILELGGKPAFPINLSVNEQAAHCTPAVGSEDVACGLLKVDIGIHVDGYVADSAFSLDLDEPGSKESEENKKIIDAAKSGLDAALNVIELGVSLGKIGKNVQEAINEKGFTPIKNLSGHQIKQYDLHAGLNIPNYDSSQDEELEEGVYAIEPFATNGLGRVKDGKPSGIYRIQKDGNVRDNFARDVLDFIYDEYETLPFCSRWIVKKFGSRGLLALRQIEQAGILHQYPQLIEEGKGKVAQAEHTVLLSEKEKIITTRN